MRGDILVYGEPTWRRLDGLYIYIYEHQCHAEGLPSRINSKALQTFIMTSTIPSDEVDWVEGVCLSGLHSGKCSVFF